MAVRALMVGLVALFAGADVYAAEPRPRSILVLDQFDARGDVHAAIRKQVENDRNSHTTVYAESLDLGRFKTEDYESSLEQHLKVKYRDKPIGVIITVGAAALELAVRWRDDLWPEVPIVFGMIHSSDFERLRRVPDLTGSIGGVSSVMR